MLETHISGQDTDMNDEQALSPVVIQAVKGAESRTEQTYQVTAETANLARAEALMRLRRTFKN